jgi:hypothetical protein
MKTRLQSQRAVEDRRNAMTYDANYWNSKFPQAPIVYLGRALRKQKDRVGADVRIFITPQDVIVQKIIEHYGLKKGTFNDTALACQQWVVQYLYYVDDPEANDCPEYWQFAFETFEMGTGNCHDGALLVANLLIGAGIPSYRVKVAAGWVLESPTAPLGGHCYCIYLADKKDGNDDQNWVILDWCYLEDSKLPMEQKPLAKDGGAQNSYKDIWFTFNNEYSWTQNSIVITSGLINKDIKNIDDMLQNDDLQTIMDFVDAHYKKP